MKNIIFNTQLSTFEKDVIAASNKTPILLDLWADWCSPCLVIAPMLEKALLEFDNQILLAKLEVDEGDNMKIAGHYKVRGFPTIILFQYGNEVARFSGAKPLQYIRQFIEQNAEF
ncbi:MAG: thioredoxin family protein [Gammaproteobacteria bacterium]|nr:thioredoxin family protein [Gammaproteobacteria bacterium]